MRKEDIIYKELSYKLNGIFYHVHNKLGRYCTHKQYGDAIEIVFKKEGLKYEREIEVSIDFSGEMIKGNKIDFLVENLNSNRYKSREIYYQSRFYANVKVFKSY